MTFTFLIPFYNKIMTPLPQVPIYLIHCYITWSSWTHFYNKIHEKPHVLVQMLKLGPECPFGGFESWKWKRQWFSSGSDSTQVISSSHGVSLNWKSRATSSSGVFKLGLSGWLEGFLSCKTEARGHKICQYNLTVIVNHLMNH